MTLVTIKRFAALCATGVFGCWIALRIQLRALSTWANLSEEMALVGIAVVAFVLLAVFLVPVTRGVERFAPTKLVQPLVFVSSLVVSFALGLWLYAELLPRTLDIALSRDLPYVSACCIGGVGYFTGYWLQRRLWSSPHDGCRMSAHSS